MRDAAPPHAASIILLICRCCGVGFILHAAVLYDKYKAEYGWADRPLVIK
jgi:hypothetical protein